MQPQPNNDQAGGGYVPSQQTLTGEIPQQVMIGQQQPQMVIVAHGQQVLVMEKPHNDGLITAVYILSAMSLIISPLFCGLPAFICAIIAITQNHPKGVQALIISIVCPIIGIIIAMVFLSALVGA
ncbi:MAG: hypothetical protein VYB17_03315 [Candidatus Thermoplasmatota archaeon]|nr:hypothetical protein [Candidatus Thermoplasmatota archaeon]